MVSKASICHPIFVGCRLYANVHPALILQGDLAPKETEPQSDLRDACTGKVDQMDIDIH
jgi:hypothetical protein